VATGAALALLIALVPSLVAAQAAGSQWSTALRGSSEVPPTTSTATGTFSATLDEAAGTLTWTLSVPSIQNATMAHLHQGDPFSNGPVVVDLFTPGAGNSANSISQSGTARVADLKGPLAGNFDGFVAALKTGTIYANVHSTANPAGEIRGQVTNVAAQTTGTPTPTGGTSAPAPAKTGNAGIAQTARIESGVTPLVIVVGFGIALGAAVAIGRRSTRSR